MIYAILKILSKLTIWGYFRKVKIVGRSKIPKKGPYIFVANHPSAFMDPIVVATSIKQPVYFIAAGEYVGKGVKGWFFQHILHMIPVFRPTTRPDEAHKNQDMFVRCHEHLLKNGALLIFPEGVSLTEKKLKPLKTGTVRIAIGAEELKNFELNIPIIPLGLNYSDPHTFRSDLFVKIGDPIYPNQLLNEEAKQDKALQMNKIREITDQLQDAMQSTILHLGSNQEELMFAKLDAIYARNIKAQFEIAFKDQESEFEMQKDFIAAIRYFKKTNPVLYYGAEDKIDSYLALLKENKLNDKDIAEFQKRYQFHRVFSFIFGFPFFLFGFIHNFIPYKTVGFFTRRIKPEETFEGSTSLAIGLFVFLFWYAGISILIGYTALDWFALFYPVLMYITGLYTLLYITAIKHSKQRQKLREIAQSNQSVIQKLINKRKEIITIIVACQQDYLTEHEET